MKNTINKGQQICFYLIHTSFSIKFSLNWGSPERRYLLTATHLHPNCGHPILAGDFTHRLFQPHRCSRLHYWLLEFAMKNTISKGQQICFYLIHTSFSVKFSLNWGSPERRYLLTATHLHPNCGHPILAGEFTHRLFQPHRCSRLHYWLLELAMKNIINKRQQICFYLIHTSFSVKFSLNWGSPERRYLLTDTHLHPKCGHPILAGDFTRRLFQPHRCSRLHYWLLQFAMKNTISKGQQICFHLIHKSFSVKLSFNWGSPERR